MKTPKELPVTVHGVFGYLDAILSQSALDVLKEMYLGNDVMIPFPHWSDCSSGVYERLKAEFRLEDARSPLRQALAPFRLYHPDDIACALTRAYCLHLRGEEPLEALTEEYGLRNDVVLRWLSVEEVKNGEPKDWLWNKFAQHYREGDRFAAFASFTQTGTLLIRGDRRVWEVIENFLSYDGIPPHFQAALKVFQAFGGWRAFVAGKFDWPPENWEERFPEMIHGAGRLQAPEDDSVL